MEHIQQALQYILHIDTYLMAFVTAYGMWSYAVLFAIIFLETGLVITPFLPGDSLIFAAGGIAAGSNHPLSIQLLFVVLFLASTLGNKLNYLLGKSLGPQVFSFQNSWLLNQKYLQQAHAFYEKHGGKTIIFARFMPIIRTFAPFVAGVASMSLKRFSLYNVISAVLWIGTLLLAGYWFGTLPLVKDHFTTLIYAVIAISLLPPTVAMAYKKLNV